MKKTLGAVVMLCAVGGNATAQTVSDAAFLRQLSLFNLGIQTAIRDSAAIRWESGDLAKDDVRAMVLADLAGWAVPEAFVRAAFDDPSVKIIPDIPGRFKPVRNRVELAGLGGHLAHVKAEDYDRYRKNFITDTSIKAGAAFYTAHEDLLERISEAYGVDPGVLVSLVGVETFYGAEVGNYPVFSALYTIAVKIPARRKWAVSELVEWLRLCYRYSLNPNGIKGSYAGAFGYFQFLPSSFNYYAVDLDGDGRVSFDQWPDVLASVANYLKSAGWETGGDLVGPGKNYAALYSYNHLDSYVRVIVELRSEILKRRALPGKSL